MTSPSISVYSHIYYADQLMHKSYVTRASIPGQKAALDSRRGGGGGGMEFFGFPTVPKTGMVKFSRIGHFQCAVTC